MKKKAEPRKSRYDEENPVLSFRVPRADLDTIKEKIEEEGGSIGQFLREAFNVSRIEEDVTYHRGYRKGYEVAKKRYAIYVHCLGCGDPVAVVDKQLKEAAEDLYYDNFGLQALHGDCPVPSDSRPEDCTVMKGEISPGG